MNVINHISLIDDKSFLLKIGIVQEYFKFNKFPNFI